MAADIIDIIASLTLIMEEETARLQNQQRDSDLAELVSVKLRLAGLLEQETVRLNRESSDWIDRLDEERRARLLDALVGLNRASSANATLLERQLELSSEMMEAFAREARRLAGKRASTYGAAGGLSPVDLATPISINSHY
jgi:flagellar biosynthesis/type III secretory pathway chaperone